MDSDMTGGTSEQILQLKREVDILQRELVVQGEQLSREVLERKTEVGRLKIVIDTFKRLMERQQPGFIAQFERLYSDEGIKFDPESEKYAG